VVGILGLAYKENTNSLKNSPSIALLEALPDVAIRAHDPVVTTVTTNQKLTLCDTALDVAKGADILCLMTPWDAFKTLDWPAIKTAMRGRVVIDPYRLLAPALAKELGLTHAVLGRADH
jgi:UDPglucose 6-dehydrogenase